ncbi:MAG: nodulation protein NfeD [Bacteroidales bacterium]|nr:nodulation protein NfeD [Bacteroidales bacterium]
MFHGRRLGIFLIGISFTLGLSGMPDVKRMQMDDTVKVFQFDMNQQVDKALWRITQVAFNAAESWGADVILIRMNTYGGLVNMADSIRTKILNYKKPVYVFVDNNAASAGSLIAISCDSIYMRPGANIGAATVVNQSGEVVPDKFQSYMRSTMRSTAEAHGKDTLLVGNDTVIRWHRDPKIAEAMVDPSVYIKGVIDTGKVLTFTTREAIKWGFCEAETENTDEVLKHAGIEQYQLKYYRLSALEKVIGFLLSPVIQGILILLIIGGIYFELQTPGIGFPIMAAAAGALLYFAPLYLEGLAEHWEILLFVAGIGLLLVEIFAIPGFGIAGISGITLIITGLALSLVGNVALDFSGVSVIAIFKSFAFVIVAFFIALLFSIWLSQKLITSSPFGFLALHQVQRSDKGYISARQELKTLLNREGEAYSILRPSGKVMIDGEVYDAIAESSWIPRGSRVLVVKQEATQIYVKKLD